MNEWWWIIIDRFIANLWWMDRMIMIIAKWVIWSNIRYGEMDDEWSRFIVWWKMRDLDSLCDLDLLCDERYEC
jgi:hypothetical protein